MPVFSLERIAFELGAELKGSGQIQISGVQNIEQAGAADIALLLNRREYPLTKQTPAAALLVADWLPEIPAPQIKPPSPRLAMAKLLRLFQAEKINWGVHPTALIHPSVKLPSKICIGPYVVIEENCQIGEESELQMGVKIYPNVLIGSHVLIQAGAVIGSDGFGYVWDGESHFKMPHRGGVIIEDNVEIGSGTLIDQGVLEPTRIGQGTKIDSKVHIAHNCQIGKQVLIVSGCDLGGSCVLGDHVLLAAQVGIGEHVHLGEHTQVLAKSGVVKDFPAHSVLSGFPARPHRENLRQWAKQNRK